MSFVSGSFLLGFFPALLVAFVLASHYAPRAAMPVLLLGSIGFYLLADASWLPLLAVSCLVNFGLGGLIDRARGRSRNAWLALGVLLNLLPLFWFKYGPASGAGGVQPPGAFVGSGIPLGLSFYTFGQLSFLIDIYRGEPARLGLPRYALFAGFFAQLPAGPITRWRDLAPQIATIGQRAVPLAAVAAGLSLFTIGLVKKSLLGDSLGHFVNAVHRIAEEGRAPNFTEAWLATWGFLLQLYFDFSGYSDMAIGAAMCVGLKLAVNFNSPLQAGSAGQFVDRWHMSLVGWIREYLYQPIFKLVRRLPGPPQRVRLVAWAIGTVGSMSVIGAWHGSAPLLWVGGIVFGVVLVLMQLPSLLWPKTQRGAGWHRKPVATVVWRVLLMMWIATLVLSVRARDAGTLWMFLQAMVDPASISLPTGWASALAALLPAGLRFEGLLPGVAYAWRFDIGVLLMASVIALTLPNTMQLFGLLPPGVKGSRTAARVQRWRWRPTGAWGVIAGVFVVLAVLFTGSIGGQEFIYARF